MIFCHYDVHFIFISFTLNWKSYTLKKNLLVVKLCFFQNASIEIKQISFVYHAGSKKIEIDRNWGIGKDRTFLSLPTHHFASPQFYLFLSPH